MLTEKIEKGAQDIVFVYTTCSDWEEARNLGLGSIEKRLGVCADFWEINSVYPWHGVMQEVSQYMLMITTEENKSQDLIKYIESLHSYTTPMITKLASNLTNNNYRSWVDDILNDKNKFITEKEQKKIIEQDEDDGYHFGRLK